MDEPAFSVPMSPKIGPPTSSVRVPRNFYPLVKTTSAVSPTSSARVPKNFPPGVKTTGEVSPSQFEGHAIRAARSKQCSKMVVPVILFRVMGSEAGGLPLVAMSRDNQGLVAIKILNPGWQGSREFCTEVMVLSKMNHPNLVKLVGFCADDDRRLLVYEFMPLGSLETHIFDLPPDKKPLDWNTRMKILAGAAQGLKHLHVNCNPPVINCGVKCANILLGEGYHPKLSDFFVPSRVVGTPGRKAYPYSMGQNRMGAELTLVQWAANLIARKDFGTLVDQMLTNQYSITELCRALTIARMCLKRTASERPEMVDVAAALAYIST
ncbi:Serine/threonine-protein kinase PBS1 [Hordeum vulgare]|nr:Serine/threonine-protein kinase PBS1 [Hordeum vulgare]